MASVLRKVRVGLVVGAALLVAVIAGFLWWGKMRLQRLKLELPKRLGVNITQESDRFSYSQSSKGKTIFTIHAAKEIQRANGTVTLHDAGIELYGRQDGHTDKIHGQEFLFDKDKGLMTGIGDVYIDLAAPQGKAAAAGATDQHGESTIHVKTRGLVFDQKAQTAATDEGIEFAASGVTGTAIGAEYDAKTGRVELRSAVHVNGRRGDRPVVVTASWAELERQQNVVVLRGARYTEPGRGGEESVMSDRAQVHITADGTPQEIDGQGHVVLAAQNRGTMTGEEMQLSLNETGKPTAGRVWGGVRYEFQSPVKQAHGSAQAVRVEFDAAGNPARGGAQGGVTFQDRMANQERALKADRVQLGFAQVSKGKSSVQELDGYGNAAARMAGTTVKGKSSTEVDGDELKAHFVPVGGEDAIRTLDGTGHTVVHQVGVDGTDETSRGATLAVVFKPGAGGAKSAAGEGRADAAAEIERAVQRGGVMIVRTTPAKAGGAVQAQASAAGSGLGSGVTKSGSGLPQVEHASGNEAVYEADGDRLTLTGGAQVNDASSMLFADQVTMFRGSGDATADGNVRVSYLSEDGKGEPLHITAARAVEKKALGTADFFGTAEKDARMWQASSQVQAPVLSFSQNGKDTKSRRLVAHGDLPGDADFVRAVLVSAGSSGAGRGKSEDAAQKASTPADGRPGGGVPGEGGSGGPVRIVGHTMTYVEAARTVEFDGRVKVQDQDGTMVAQEAIAYLAESRPAASQGSGAAGSSSGAAGGYLMAGRIERMVATGAVQIEQPGRTGTGEQLVST